MSKQQKIIHTVLLCSSFYTVKLFAPPADEQDFSTTPVTQIATSIRETVGELSCLITQHTPTYCTDKITPKGAALTAGTLVARALYVCYFQNPPKSLIPTAPALRPHQDRRGQASLLPPHAKAFQPTYTQHLFQNVPSQSLTQAVIEGLKTDVQTLEKQKT